ncbi:MAG: V-type ATP synthase subunit E family protein, partial [Oscillospiraceae bacterium]|nr:V-type ATP synthase subunit E family protein [Oscillospiraceae bacterium]
MSLDKITARLYSDSERECAELVRKATEDAKHLLLSASEEACALVSAERESAEKDAETIIEKARSAASASERRAVLKAKSELIETVLLSAKKQLLAL